MFNWKKWLVTLLPFSIGLFLGAGLTKNKYVYVIFIAFMIIMVLKNVLMKFIYNLATGKNKKEVLVKETEKTLGTFIDIIEPIFSTIYSNFDKFFPVYTFMVCLIMLGYNIYYLVNQSWLGFWITFFAINIFIVLNNIWRKVKGGVVNEYVEINKK
jgi:uncharacterized membrane protein YfcA